MTKRTAKEIENDYKKIKELVETSFITSVKEIVEATGLTVQEIKTSLAKHPRVEKRIMAKLEKNRQERSLKREETKKTPAKEKDTEAKVEKEAKKDEFLGYVIDNSIIEVANILDSIEKICASCSKIILTSITINELEDSQEYRNSSGNVARHILAMAAEDPKHFYSVIIDETLKTKDDCIVKYCADNKGKVILLTADKTMAIKARAYGVETQYFKQNVIDKNEEKDDKNTNRSYTLAFTRKVNGDLIIAATDGNVRSTLVKSNGIEYSGCECRLEIGDDVFVAVKKGTYITFSHFMMTSLYERKNCKLIFSGRYYNLKSIDNLQNAEYKDFLLRFAKKVFGDKSEDIANNSVLLEKEYPLNTLYNTYLKNGKLYLHIVNDSNRSTIVMSNGVEYSSGEYELKIGDDVYIAKRKYMDPKSNLGAHEYFTFVHYKIISLAKENNCVLIYHKGIPNLREKFRELPKPEYKRFLRDFRRRIVS